MRGSQHGRESWHQAGGEGLSLGGPHSCTPGQSWNPGGPLCSLPFYRMWGSPQGWGWRSRGSARGGAVRHNGMGARSARSPVCLEGDSGEGDLSGIEPSSPTALLTLPQVPGMGWGAALLLSYACPCPPGEGPKGPGFHASLCFGWWRTQLQLQFQHGCSLLSFPFMTNKRDCKPCMCTKCTL